MGEVFSVGDRVLLKPCPSWNLPWCAFANEGRLATIESIASWGQLKIRFDVRRKGAKGRDLWVSARDLIPTPPKDGQ